MDVLVDRCAALDVHKDTVMACVRKPGPSGKRRVQEVREFGTWTSSLGQLRDWLREGSDHMLPLRDPAALARLISEFFHRA